MVERAGCKRLELFPAAERAELYRRVIPFIVAVILFAVSAIVSIGMEIATLV